LTKLLCEEGGMVETGREDGQLVMRKRSCPFISMVDDTRIVCAVDLEMMTEVVGRPVRLTACRHKGDPCCVVEILDDE
jgi:predicted ArsR family transcriptional regulator